MRSILLSIALLAAAPAVASTPAPSHEPAFVSASDTPFFLQEVDPSEIARWDGSANVQDAQVRVTIFGAAAGTGGTGGTGTAATTVAAGTDFDGDGFFLSTDCNDADANIFPGAVEIVADGIDQDCNLGDLCYLDADFDGYGGSLTQTSADLTCSALGLSGSNADCLDAGTVTGSGGAIAAPDISPDAAEACDEVDNDCDALTDDADPGLTGAPDWFADEDGDGLGNGDDLLATACVAPEGAADNGDDCDDTDAEVADECGGSGCGCDVPTVPTPGMAAYALSLLAGAGILRRRAARR